MRLSLRGLVFDDLVTNICLCLSFHMFIHHILIIKSGFPAHYYMREKTPTTSFLNAMLLNYSSDWQMDMHHVLKFWREVLTSNQCCEHRCVCVCTCMCIHVYVCVVHCYSQSNAHINTHEYST
jgi:hypothetical protein